MPDTDASKLDEWRWEQAWMTECEPMYAGEDGWSEWTHPLPGYLMQCCDCGLIHEAQFQISQRLDDSTGALNPGESVEAGVVIFRMRRHRKAAAG